MVTGSKPVIAAIEPTFPVIIEVGVLVMAALDRMTKLLALPRFTGPVLADAEDMARSTRPHARPRPHSGESPVVGLEESLGESLETGHGRAALRGERFRVRIACLNDRLVTAAEATASSTKPTPLNEM
mmetsp:Transcript_20708/g.48592  ORF Transcript_20708/g.48592 Transcript_20708/m.48592 type:complete len:128 (+) Transcript_20708:181-564(+)